MENLKRENDKKIEELENAKNEIKQSLELKIENLNDQIKLLQSSSESGGSGKGNKE